MCSEHPKSALRYCRECVMEAERKAYVLARDLDTATLIEKFKTEREEVWKDYKRLCEATSHLCGFSAELGAPVSAKEWESGSAVSVAAYNITRVLKNKVAEIEKKCADRVRVLEDADEKARRIVTLESRVAQLERELLTDKAAECHALRERLGEYESAARAISTLLPKEDES